MTERQAGQRYYEKDIVLPPEVAERLFQPPSIAEEIDSLSHRVKHHVATLETERDQYRTEARTDPLTQLPNRAGLKDWVDPIIVNCLRQRELGEQRQNVVNGLEIAVIDIDKFKAVNDKRGHQVGDEVLKWLAAEVRSQVRTEDMVARIGGEEFVIGFSGAGLETASERAEKLRLHIEVASRQKLEEWGIEDRRSLTISLGLADFDNSCDSYEDVFLRADAALYAAKKDRNRVVSFNPNDPDMVGKVRGA